LNIPLTALKTENSWGVGDFSDLHILTQWVKVTGIKMIQLLPINDTTANFTTSDSYPYASISAFALHPIYLDVSLLGKNYGIEFNEAITLRASQLNELSLLNYTESLILKLEAIDKVFQMQKTHFINEKAYQVFFANNESWLVPYAIFCCLRDEYKTADFNQWGKYSSYVTSLFDDLIKVNSSFRDRINFYFFIQYHLHLQLSAAVSFAHENGVILKGDLPIGVGRCSVETWMNPQLFHMDLQAGAPPDAFSSKGQNWGFPTYNWNEMKKDQYQWWRNRLHQMSRYFDAVRIDHVLGFFRIWSVPMHAIEGVFGVFDPAIPLTIEDFKNNGIEFDEQKYCEPFFSDEQLMSIFDSDFNWVKDCFFSNGRFKEDYNTQIKIQNYFNQNTSHTQPKEKLFDLLSDVLLFRDDQSKGGYHFRINFQQTYRYTTLSTFEKTTLEKMYWNYFYEKQNNYWESGAIDKLDMIQNATDMLICAEDLGMVPEMVEEVLLNKEILTLQVQRMPKRSHEKFSHPENAPYLSVVTPSTHDMSTIRQWWQEDSHITSTYFREVLHQNNIAPISADTALCKLIIKQHMNASSMWAVFLLQDLLSIDEECRRENLDEERINNPANPYHYWNYRMHISLELLLKQRHLNETIKQMIIFSKR
jgi:4-alpha-glucanotransferase